MTKLQTSPIESINFIQTKIYMKQHISFILACLLLSLSFPCLASIMDSTKLNEITEQLVAHKILSDDGVEELIQYVETGSSSTIDSWRSSSGPRFDASATYESSDSTKEVDFTNITVLSFLSSIEYIHGKMERELRDPKYAPKNAKVLIKSCERIKATSWNNYRSSLLPWQLNEAQIRKTKEDLKWWINTLHQSFLITSPLKTEVLKWIEEGHFIEEVQGDNATRVLFGRLASASMYYNFIPYINEMRLEYVDSLYQRQWIQKDNYEELFRLLKLDTILLDEIEVINYVDGTFILDADEYRGDPNNAESVYRFFLENVQQHLLPNLRMDSIQQLTETVESTYVNESPLEVDYLRIVLNGIPYRQYIGTILPNLPENRYISYEFEPRVAFTNTYFIQSYLADQGFEERLFYVTDQNFVRQKVGSRLLAALLSDEARHLLQGVTLHPHNWLFDPAIFNQLTFEETKNKIIDLQSYGILSSLTEIEIEALVPIIRSTSYDHTYYMLKMLPNALADIYVQVLEYTPLEEYPYELPIIIKRLAEASNGNFIPENIQKGWKEWREEDDFPYSFGFELSGKPYNVIVENEKQERQFWDKNKIIDLVNDALKDQGIRERFFPLKIGFREYLFVTEENFNRLVSAYPDLVERY